MKASTIASAATLFTSALAAPTLIPRSSPDYFSFSLNNDISGASEARSVVINSAPVSLGQLFASSALVQAGKVIASSAQNVHPLGRNIFCIFTDPATGNVVKMNDKITFAKLDGNNNMAVQTDVTGFTLQCEE